MAGPITVTREGNLVEIKAHCTGRRLLLRCGRWTSFKLSIWSYYGEESSEIMNMIRRQFWVFGWKEQPKQKGGGFLCPRCRGSHDPHRTGIFPPYLDTPK